MSGHTHGRQCSPYQVVTSKIYCLKQNFLPPASTWSFTKIKWVVLKNMEVVIQSDEGNENEYAEKYLSIHSFSFYGPCILEREHWRHSKIYSVGIKHFKLLSKDNNSWFA